MRKGLSRALPLLVAFTLVFACVTTSSAAKFKAEYKLSCNVAEVTPMGQGIALFAKEVKEKTNGQINIKVYWLGQFMAGKATNELMLMRRGEGDFSVSSLINWAPQFVEGNLFLLPFFVSSQPNTYKALDAIEAGKAGKMLEQDILDRFKLNVLSWGEQGARQLSNNVRSVRTPEDLKNLKIRVVGSPLFLEIFHALGANPMNISWGETLTALQQNTVDGQENPWANFTGMKMYEFQKYFTEWSYNVDPLMYCVYKPLWDSFPADIQKIIKECAERAGRYNKSLARLGIDDGSAEKWLRENNLMPNDEMIPHNPRQFVRDKGVVVTELTSEEIAAFAELTKPVMENWIEKVGRDLYNAAVEDMKSVQ